MSSDCYYDANIRVTDSWMGQCLGHRKCGRHCLLFLFIQNYTKLNKIWQERMNWRMKDCCMLQDMLDKRDKIGRKSVIYLISQSQAGYNCKERGRVIWNMLSSANILKISVYCTALIISTRQTRHHCNSQIIVCTSLCSYVFSFF